MTSDGGYNTYAYDAWNRLVTVSQSGTVLYRYKYTADLEMGSSTDTCQGTTTDTYYSADWQEIEDRSGSTVTTQYVWGLGYIDNLVLRDDNSSGGSYGKTSSGLGRRLFAQQDANHNVTAIVNTSGTVQERFIYNPYGAVTDLTASWSTGPTDYQWRYLFQGGKLDSFTGLYKFRARDYNPSLGVWMEEDPLQFINGLNRHQMELSDPVGYTDPEGMDAEHPECGPDPQPGSALKNLGIWKWKGWTAIGHGIVNTVDFIERNRKRWQKAKRGLGERVHALRQGEQAWSNGNYSVQNYLCTEAYRGVRALPYLLLLTGEGGMFGEVTDSVLMGGAEEATLLNADAITTEVAQETASQIQGNIPLSAQTVCIMQTAEGPAIVTASGKGLTSLQSAIAEAMGLTPGAALGEGFHAEINGLYTAGETGLTPIAGVTTNPMCTSGAASCYAQMNDLASQAGLQVDLSSNGTVFTIVNAGAQ